MSGRLWRRDWPDHASLRCAVSVTVPFQDADPTGVAWHGNYFRYYDAARVELLDRLGFGYRAMAEVGQLWPVVETQVRYLQPLPYGTTAQVSAQLVEWAYRMRLYYRITLPDGALANEAVTLQVPVDARTNQIVIGVPDHWRARVETLIAAGDGA
ncbi:MAG: acyl-CoA thioesterase [Pseudomonadota bacterium]